MNFSNSSQNRGLALEVVHFTFILPIMLRLFRYLCLGILTTQVPLAYSSPRLHKRDDGYENAVCYPSVAPGSPLPPCVSIANQQISCAPSGNGQNYLLSAQSCLCDSTFFQDWVGCQNCLFYHGILNENWYDAWTAEITSVSRTYCYGTPTMYFPDVFSSMTYSMASVTTGASAYRDKAPGKTDISLYYTLPISNQGLSTTTSGSSRLSHKVVPLSSSE